MVRSSFPGKPAKYFTRKKCSSSVNNLDVEGFTVAEELIKSLGVFESLFQDSVEDSSFHGFTNADINRARKRANLKNLLKPSKCRNDSSKLLKKKAESTEPFKSEGDEVNSGATTPSDGSSDRSAPCNSECVIPAKDNVAPKEGDATAWSNNALSGKFVLPSRSAHSSRVIKPNKRFFPNEQNSVVHKKSRTDGVVLQSSDQAVETVSPSKAKMDQDSSMSPVTKVILRKPKLNLKSEPFPAFDGPFSSSSSSSLGAQDNKNRRRPSTKVVCGVCGSVRLYKNLQHARKFGIFSCELCRKFIVKMLKLDREGNIQQFSCSSGNGTCQIRQSALEVNTFPTVMKKSISKSHITERCQACWLYVSLRSFRLPKEILQRLNRYLPDSFAGKIDYIKNRSQSPSSSSWYSGSEDIGSGSSALTCVTATKRVVKNKASKQVQCRKGEVKNYENLSRGPRIKHVCRSALQVLGQTPATFPEKKSNKVADEPLKEKKTKTDKLPPSKNNSKSRSNSVESLVEPLAEASPAESIDDDCDLNSGQPVARMLQDLGRCNNELLDWAEGLGDIDRHLARITLDYWQPYDPDEALITGFPLLAPNPICVPSVCFLCGSAGQHKLLRCLVCCEPYHTFCVPNFRFIKEPSSEMTVKWACPKCTQCVVCSELGGSQQSCNKCRKSYHAFCLPGSARFNSTDALWTCPACLCCKSCNGTVVDLFLGNIPLCKSCFRQRKKGNFCPLCQRCYDENDYSTKMMECGKCKCWVHADCEGLTEEKYQILSYLPPQIEFICRMCCTNLPSSWSLAIEEELKAGYLKVFKILTKNRAICSMIKSTPKKIKTCSQCSTRQIRPIPIKDEFTSNVKYSNTNGTSVSSVKSSDSGLLTPTFTRDDEKILKDSKTNFPGFVDDKLSCGRTGKIIRCSNPLVIENEVKTTGSENSGLSIGDLSDDKSSSSVSAIDKCTCEINDNSKSSMSLMSIKNKAASNEYLSVAEFHRDVDKVMGELSFMDLRKAYLKALKIAFPWFKVDAASLPIEVDSVSSSKNLSKMNRVSEVKITNSPERHKPLVNIDAVPQKIDFEEAFDDKRICLLCKAVGEGALGKEERLLYCGNSEWVHANCALWSSEVFEEIDGSLQNVQSAVSRSRHLRCSVCSQKGASVGCCAKSCSMAFHFSCAVDSNCVLLESKEVYCKNHGHLSESKDLQRDFTISRSIYVELDRRKKKGVPKDWAKLLVGTLYIDNFGEVRPEVSDKADLILPIDFSCSRLFWSSTDPLKMIKYFIKTKLIKSEVEYSPENDINYTIDHSLDFTPPPSPIEDLSRKTKIVDDKDVRAVLNQLIETVCVKEEEINLVDQQGPDLLPPEIKDAIFEDLPHDLLAGICMQDIFPKMLNCDYFVSGEASCKSEKLDPHSSRNSPVEELDRNQSHDLILKRSIGENFKNKYANFPRVDERKQVNLQCRLRSSVNITGRTNQEMSIKPSKGNWKKGEIIQVDGQFDSSESESDNSSDDEGDNSITNNYNESKDKPVKCSRCHRTYRSNLGFTRHLPSCTVESSCSDSESSQDSKENYSGIATTEEANPPNEKTEGEIEITYNCQIVNGATEQTISVEEVRDTSTERIEVVQNTSNVEYSVGLVEGNYTVKQLHDCQLMQGFQPAQAGTSSQTLVIQQIPEPVSYVNQFPAIQPPPSIQYVQDTSPIITSQFLPGYQLQSPIAHQTVVQNVPTMLGTVVANHQPMILTNQSAIGSYATPPAALVIANQPVFVNMETVVSNTIMSSSQLISSSSVSGILETNSFSTTTQVYHSAKPPVEIPQSYVVVNGGPQVMENRNPCPVQVTQTSGILQQANTNPWATNYQVNYQESYKMDKNVSFPALSKEIMCEDKKITCKQVINTREPAIIDPLGIHDKRDQFNQSCFSSSGTSNSKSGVALEPCTSRVTVPPLVNKIKPNQVKKVDLPESSAVGKEKPQQAVAPVVVRSVPSYLNKKPTPTLVSNSYRNHRLNKPQPVLNKSEGIQTDINTHLKNDSPRPLQEETIKPIQQSSASDKLNCKDKSVIEKPEDAGKPDLSEKPVAPIRSPSPEKVKQVHSENQKVKNGFKNGPDPKLKEAFSVPKIEKSKGDQPVVETKKSVEKEKKVPADMGQQAIKLASNKPNGVSKLKPESNVGPKVSYEITSEDGFSYTTDNIVDAWNKVFIKVQEARASKGLEPLPQNPYTDRNAALKGLMGLGTNSVKFILEQLPGASRCMKYTPSFHKRQMSVAEKLMTSYRENRSGCARSEPLTKGPKSYDMFNWLASRHRRPPSLLDPHADLSNGNSRRGNLNLPMAMRFRHLKETSKKSVGVFRSDIHGRGLFCLRNIDNGEMIIEYAGELIRSSLTDTRERYYTARGMGCYMFRIDDKYVVDATMKGNAARFINHSCEPNCYSRIVEILGKKHILIFALRRIKQGEELTYDYKFPLEDDKISCHCLSRKCRKYLN